MWPVWLFGPLPDCVMGLCQELHRSPHDQEATPWERRADNYVFVTFAKVGYFNCKHLTTDVFSYSDFPSAASSYSDFPCHTSLHVGDMMLERPKAT